MHDPEPEACVAGGSKCCVPFLEEFLFGSLSGFLLKKGKEEACHGVELDGFGGHFGVGLLVPVFKKGLEEAEVRAGFGGLAALVEGSPDN